MCKEYIKVNYDIKLKKIVHHLTFLYLLLSGKEVNLHRVCSSGSLIKLLEIFYFFNP